MGDFGTSPNVQNKDSKSSSKSHRWVTIRDFQRNTLCIIDNLPTIGNTTFQWTSAQPENIPQRDIICLSFLQYVSKQRPRPITAPETNIDVIIRCHGTPPRYLGSEADCVLKTVREPNSYCVWSMEAYEDGFFTLQHPTGKYLSADIQNGLVLVDDSSLNWFKLLKMEPTKNGASDSAGGQSGLRSADGTVMNNPEPVSLADRRKSSLLGLTLDISSNLPRQSLIVSANEQQPLSARSGSNGGAQPSPSGFVKHSSPRAELISASLLAEATAHNLEHESQPSNVSNNSSHMDTLRATNSVQELTRKLSSRQVNPEISLPRQNNELNSRPANGSNMRQQTGFSNTPATPTFNSQNNQTYSQQQMAAAFEAARAATEAAQGFEKPRLAIQTDVQRVANDQLMYAQNAAGGLGAPSPAAAQMQQLLQQNQNAAAAAQYQNSPTMAMIPQNDATMPTNGGNSNFKAGNFVASSPSAATAAAAAGGASKKYEIPDGESDASSGSVHSQGVFFDAPEINAPEFNSGVQQVGARNSSYRKSGVANVSMATPAAADLNCCVSIQDGRGRMLSRSNRFHFKKLSALDDALSAAYFTVHVVALDPAATKASGPGAPTAPARIPQLADALVMLRFVSTRAYLADLAVGGSLGEIEKPSEMAIWQYRRLPHHPFAFSLIHRATGRLLSVDASGELLMRDPRAAAQAASSAASSALPGAGAVPGGAVSASSIFMLVVPLTANEAITAAHAPSAASLGASGANLAAGLQQQGMHVTFAGDAGKYPGTISSSLDTMKRSALTSSATEASDAKAASGGVDGAVAPEKKSWLKKALPYAGTASAVAGMAAAFAAVAMVGSKAGRSTQANVAAMTVDDAGNEGSGLRLQSLAGSSSMLADHDGQNLNDADHTTVSASSDCEQEVESHVLDAEVHLQAMEQGLADLDDVSASQNDAVSHSDTCLQEGGTLGNSDSDDHALCFDLDDSCDLEINDIAFHCDDDSGVNFDDGDC